MQHVPFLYLPEPVVKRTFHLFVGVSYHVQRLLPGFSYDMEQSGLDAQPVEYISRVLVNALLIFLAFFGLLFALNKSIAGKETLTSLWLSALLALLFFFIITGVLLSYPRILAGKRAEQINKHLVFALKDLLLQVGSGVSLYNAIVNVSKAGYGQVSIEFEKAAKSVSTGTPMTNALEQMALESKSEFLRRTTWQLVNTLKAGASIKNALRIIIDDLTIEQRAKIADYARELNLWTLIYMLFAVAIPTIGAVMLVILSSFAGVGISRGMFITFLGLCVIIQYVLIGFVKARRPVVSI